MMMKMALRAPSELRASRPGHGESLAGKPPETYVIPLCDPRRDGVPYFSFVEVLRQGSTIYSHAHQRAYETFYVLRGRGTLDVEGERIEMIPGGAYTVMPGFRHSLWNEHEERLYVHILLAPDEGFVDAVYDGEEVTLDAEDLRVLQNPGVQRRNGDADPR